MFRRLMSPAAVRRFPLMVQSPRTLRQVFCKELGAIVEACLNCDSTLSAAPRGTHMLVTSGYKNQKICAALLLLMCGAGCRIYDKSGRNPTVNVPTVSSVTPPNAAATACPNTIV